jgi:arginine:pyruvate transaminase
MSKNGLSMLTERISGPTSGAWAIGDLALQRMEAGEDIIHLGIGDPDLDTPQPVQDALFSAIHMGKTHYSPLAGESDLRAAIANHASDLYGGEVSEENVVVCNGAQGALFSTFLCLTEKGDEIIILEPTYATYPAVVTAGGGTMVPVVLDKSKGYQLDLNKIKEAVTKKTKVILINSPGNPTGTVFDQNALIELAKFCKENSIWLVSDEVYWSLCYDGPHASAYFAKQYRDTIIVINSLSKSHAMTGWRIGWAIGPKHFTESMTNLSQALHFSVNQFVQAASIVAFRQTETVEKFRQLFLNRRNAICDGLVKSNHLSFSVPKGGMFILLDISQTGLSGKEFAEQLLDEEKVAVVPGFGFGTSVENTVRIGFLCDEERLSQAAKRIVRFAESLMHRQNNVYL